ncbi:MAG: PfkB family carbohydrate kinase [Lentimicrobiaceae bacterium]|nr:PfkB family carbohydrate kinase [Lentimicrobiaceae bacterium]
MIQENRQIDDLFEAFKGCRILIMGDVMIDAYLWGKVDRISPEAPVPVVQLDRRESMLGGAANVALNIKALGGEPLLCSMVGDDARADEFVELLTRSGIDASGIYRSKARLTTTKFRIIGNNAQLIRVDEEVETDLNAEEEEMLLAGLQTIIQTKQPGAVILQDYNKGVLSSNVIDRAIQLFQANNIFIAVDPKKKNFENYRGVDLFKPNLKELREGLKCECKTDDPEALRQAARTLHQQQQIQNVLITLSDKGIFMSSKHGDDYTEISLPAHLRKIADVSGAGDTVISVAALCRAAGADMFTTAALANLAGGLVCEHVGVVPVDKNRLNSEARLLELNRQQNE